jgi:succinate dehydrogenase / fumarate reductase membrane anchor subunit
MMSLNSATRHFLAQRLSAILLIPLGLWFICALNGLRLDDPGSFLPWIQKPRTFLLLVLLTLSLFHHAALGLQTILEDYVTDVKLRQTAINASQWIFIGASVFSLLFILTIAISGPAYDILPPH